MDTSSRSVPVPTGGWNARDPLFAMDDQDAIRLVNLFPNTNTVDIRNGYRLHSSGMGGSVQWLAEYAAQDGTRKLIAFANAKVWNASTLNGTATDITNGATITINKWSTVNFRNKLLMVNGTDQPLQYDGTNVTTATYTGTDGAGNALTDNNLIHAAVYKSRVYFIEKDSASVWYGGVNEVTGALTELDVSGILEKGGYLQYIGSMTRDLGDGTDTCLVLVSSVGEVLMYSMDYPGAIGTALVARCFLPVSIGRHGSLQMGSDMLLITEIGLLSLAKVLGGGDSQSPSQNVSFKINNAFRDAAQDYSSNYGWQIINYPRGHYLAVNVPLSDGALSHQYVMNTETGAWCKFTGQNAFCWCLFNEKLYFGAAGGYVYQADYGQSDNGSNISVDLKGAFNYLGDDKRLKRFTLARPVLTASDSFGFSFSVDVDFAERSSSSTVEIIGDSGSEWDTADWDTSSWAQSALYSNDWYSVAGLGRCVAPKLSGDFNSVSFSLASIDYVYELGGIL